MRSTKERRDIVLVGGPASGDTYYTTITAHSLFEIWPDDFLVPNFDSGNRAFLLYECRGPGRYEFAGYTAFRPMANYTRFEMAEK